jgi:hypothetical protein
VRKEILNLIEELQSKNQYYIITPFSKTYGKYFDELEEYLLKFYLDDYSNKICRIIMKVICYYDAEIYLTEFPIEKEGLNFVGLEYQNLRTQSLEKLHEIISYVIKRDVSSVEIVFPKEKSLISVSGHFQVVVYGDKSEFLKLVKDLSNAEGLFFKKYT